MKSRSVKAVLGAAVLIVFGWCIYDFLVIVHPAGPQETSNRLMRIRIGLEKYASDNEGAYPVGTDGTSAVLYRVLSGDLAGQGGEPTGPTYWPELLAEKPNGLVGRFNGQLVILDVFGRPFRYRSALDEDGHPVPGGRDEVDYDLWSVGPDGLPEDLDTPGTLKNEETKDDIWK